MVDRSERRRDITTSRGGVVTACVKLAVAVVATIGVAVSALAGTAIADPHQSEVQNPDWVSKLQTPEWVSKLGDTAR
ncbi:hypothetical protein [Allokutzneria oryzae]|uniref:Uncharacterized protein n=1 Tax=Allokutzneria oryzae TaxID=1378989 RepID=A0ABV6A9E6_9PSEU